MGFSNSSGDSTQQVNQTQTSSRDFSGKEASELLANLAKAYRDPVGAASGAMANKYYQQKLADGGTTNPHLESLIAAGNAEGQQVLDTNLAKARAGGFRTGAGQSLFNQQQLVTDYANKRATGNANLRYGAFNDAQAQQANAAGALQGQSNQMNAQQMQLLNLLGGTTSKTKGTTTGSQSQSGTSFDAAGALSALALGVMAF